MNNKQNEKNNSKRREIVAKQLLHFTPIGLEQLNNDNDSLFAKRFDIKFLLHDGLLEALLEKVKDRYQVLTINDLQIQNYNTLYFDNNESKFYLDHQNGRSNRYKIRYRNYVDSKINFIEVKYKDSKRQTSKWRKKIQLENFEKGVLTNSEFEFLNSIFPKSPGRLFARFEVEYSRIILKHKEKNERVTLDLNLRFKKGKDSIIKTPINNLSIAEVKKESISHNSEFIQALRDFRIPATRFSKFCFGVHLYYPELKYNRFKEAYLLLNKMTTNNNLKLI